MTDYLSGPHLPPPLPSPSASEIPTELRPKPRRGRGRGRGVAPAAPRPAPRARALIRSPRGAADSPPVAGETTSPPPGLQRGPPSPCHVCPSGPRVFLLRDRRAGAGAPGLERHGETTHRWRDGERERETETETPAGGERRRRQREATWSRDAPLPHHGPRDREGRRDRREGEGPPKRTIKGQQGGESCEGANLRK